MEALKEEALYEAIERVQGKSSTLTPFVISDFAMRPLKNGRGFNTIVKKDVELPRIDEIVTEDIELNDLNTKDERSDTDDVQESVEMVGPVEDDYVVPIKTVSTKRAKSTSAKSKRKSSKRKYDIDLIS